MKLDFASFLLYTKSEIVNKGRTYEKENDVYPTVYGICSLVDSRMRRTDWEMREGRFRSRQI